MHTNKLNGKKYVGITGQIPEKRWAYGRGYIGCTIFYNAIKKYTWDNFEPEILEDKLTKEEAEQKEREYITFYRSTDRRYGYNILDGSSWDNETRSSLLRGEWDTASCRKVDQYDVNHNFIKTWHSASEAQRQIGVSMGAINHSCNGERPHTVGGFYWAYHGEEPSWGVNKLIRPVAKICSNTRSVVAVFYSAGEAGRRTGRSNRSVFSECTGMIKSKEGYFLRFLDAYSVGGHVIDKVNFSEITPKNAGSLVIPTSKFKYKDGVSVDQYDIHHNFIKTWNNIVDAESRLEINRTSIEGACKYGVPYTAGGYYWSYHGSQPFWRVDTRSIPVAQLNIKDKSVINVFTSAKKASIETSVNKRSILDCCKGKNKNPQKYFWCYIDAHVVAGHIIDKQTFREVGIAEAASLLILPKTLNIQNELKEIN